jgi:hypothetical protein
MPSVFQLNIILPFTTRSTKRAVNMSVHIKKFRFAEISAKAGSVTRKEGYCLRTDNTDLRLHKTVNSEQNVLGIAKNRCRKYGAFCNSQPVGCCSMVKRFNFSMKQRITSHSPTSHPKPAVLPQHGERARHFVNVMCTST